MDEYREGTGAPSLALIKAEILSNGLSLSENFIKNYGEPYLEKRKAYGNSDHVNYTELTVPQELYLLPSKTVCSVNIRPESIWKLDYVDNEFVLNGPGKYSSIVGFPLRPNFYNFSLANGVELKSVATLYGGGALGIFVYGTCSLVENNTACKYCSIEPNRKIQKEFEQVVKPEQVYEVVKNAVTLDNTTITQIMINGGNFKSKDKSFSYYIEICRAARKALDDLGSKIDLHLIAYPPENTALFRELNELDVSLAMNIEAFDKNIFNQVCPGKNSDVILSALKSASKILGKGNVYSIFVGGLESLKSMEEGFSLLSSYGVTPVINVFHPDPGTELENKLAPTTEMILKMGELLQNTYNKNEFMKPFYSGCGRNAIDTEAYNQLF